MPSHNLKHTALACLAAGSLALVNGQTIRTSRAFCRVASITRTAKVRQDAYTEAWVDIGNYVCGAQADVPVETSIETQVEAVAIAVAEAFAEVSANCQAEGNADVRAMGYAFAEQRATALGSAITEIFASSEACGQCTAAISALSQTSKEIVAEAVAEAWTDLYLFSDDGARVESNVQVTSEVITTTVAKVLSSVTATLRAAADDGCNVEAINSAQVGDYLARCELAAGGGIREISVDAIAEAGAEAAAYACEGDRAEASVDVIARATARALAEAVAQSDVYCIAEGGADTMACGLAEVDVKAVASAQAEAFATAMASAETCDCDVSSTASVSVWDEIWVKAVANAYAETCVVGNGEDFVTDFQFAVEERMLISTARAIANAVAEADDLAGGKCGSEIIVEACNSDSEQCIRNNSQCGGRGFDFVHPCCDPDYRCFVRNENSFVCRHRNFRIPSFWDGRIAACNLL